MNYIIFVVILTQHLIELRVSSKCLENIWENEKKTGANIVRYPVNSISITYATSRAFSENDKSFSTIFQVCYLNDSLVIT